jgi:hypothetical protein
MWRLYRLFVGIITCHPVSKVGGYLVTFGTISGIIYTAGTLLYHVESPYIGIIFVAVVPPSFFGGLLLIPLGVYLRFRKQRREDPGLAGKPIGKILQNLSGEEDVRNRIIIFVLFTAVNVALTMVIFVGSLEFMDSAAFCGRLCHSVMAPEYAAYQRSPHARVACVACHIGPGASWFVRSKISGLRQVYAVLAKTYSRPIPTPIEHLRPARDTCEECHWPEKFHSDKLKIITHYADDRNNTKIYTALLLKVGGPEAEEDRGGGIHWHVSGGNRVTYISVKGERMDIPWVRLEKDGQPPVEFRFTGSEMTDAEIAAAPKRTMDCVDCHNRPTHIYRTPDQELETMFRRWPELLAVPYLKKAASEVLSRQFDEAAIEGGKIGESLLAWYDNHPKENPDPGLLQQAAKQVQTIYRENIWPDMDITWGTYPNHIGHTNSPGCLRCHGNNHVTAEGTPLDSDCRLCHIILALEEENPPLFEYMVHKEQ